MAREDKLWSFAPFLPSRDKRVWLHMETNMVIRHPCQPKTIEFVGTQRQIMVICSLSKTSMSLDRDYWSLPCQPETSVSVGMRRPSWSFALLFSETITVSLCHPETSESVGIWRPSWSSSTFQRWQCLQSLHAFKRRQWPSFAFQRRKSL